MDITKIIEILKPCSRIRKGKIIVNRSKAEDTFVFDIALTKLQEILLDNPLQEDIVVEALSEGRL